VTNLVSLTALYDFMIILDSGLLLGYWTQIIWNNYSSYMVTGESWL